MLGPRPQNRPIRRIVEASAPMAAASAACVADVERAAPISPLHKISTRWRRRGLSRRRARRRPSPRPERSGIPRRMPSSGWRCPVRREGGRCPGAGPGARIVRRCLMPQCTHPAGDPGSSVPAPIRTNRAPGAVSANMAAAFTKVAWSFLGSTRAHIPTTKLASSNPRSERTADCARPAETQSAPSRGRSG